MTTEKIYNEIFKTLDRYKDQIVFDIDDLKRKSSYHLFGLELKDKYGLDIKPENIPNNNYYRVDEYRFIGWYGDKYSRRIGWSDDGSQPIDELLLMIGFSTGAYIFGEDYPTELFQKFFLELKGYGVKYCDSHNHNLYYSIDNAKEVFNNFPAILRKYYDLNKEDMKLRKIKELKDQLEKLEK